MPNEFKPINTQEEFDARVREVHGDVAGLQNQINTLTGERDIHANTIANLQKEINCYKTDALKRKIAGEKGIPLDMASRLSGDDEKALRADADAMAANLRAYKGAAPLADPTPAAEDGKRGVLRSMLRGMKGE